MKVLLIIVTLFISQPTSNDINNILVDWISSNNLHNAKAFDAFIKEHYSREKLNSIDIDDHIEFYNHAAEMFGELEAIPYKIIEQSKNKLVVQLTKKNISEEDKYKPEHVILVEIETNDDGQLDKSLGLGALICSLKE